MDLKATLTSNDLHKAIKALKKSTKEHPPYYWVDNEWFYKGGVAKEWGFSCSQEEIDLAKKHEKGFIKTAMGVDLYLTKFLPTTSNLLNREN